MTCKINLIYREFSPPSSSEEAVVWFDSSRVDFSVDERTWLKTSQKIALFTAKIVLFPWGVYELVRYFAQRLIMMQVYPAQSAILRCFYPQMQVKALNQYREVLKEALPSKEFYFREVILEKNGTRYSGLMVGRQDQIKNRKWVLQATGNCMPIEDVVEQAMSCFTIDFNLLMINGPGVGSSEGTATLETMGEAQEIGLSFLERAIKAKKIAAAGFSLGGMAMATAILKHDFKKGVHYHIISEQTFDSVANVFKKWFPQLRFLAGIISWAGCNTDDQLAAAKRLSELGIKHTIMNAGEGEARKAYADDGVIPKKAALGYRLQKEGLFQGKQFLYTAQSHFYVFYRTKQAIYSWDAPFKAAVIPYLSAIRSYLPFA